MQGTSLKDGRPGTNTKFGARAKKFMELANDKIHGEGTWQDLADEYNKICRRKQFPNLQASATTMWRWAGKMNWAIHRRWIKPVLSPLHRAYVSLFPLFFQSHHHNNTRFPHFNTLLTLSISFTTHQFHLYF